jgi:hypothetical protein
MSKDAIQRLSKYQADIKSKLDSEVPAKHLNRVESYKAFLTKEYKMVTKKIDDLKMSGSDKK